MIEAWPGVKHKGTGPISWAFWREAGRKGAVRLQETDSRNQEQIEEIEVA